MEWKLEKRKISDLKLNEKNPRKLNQSDAIQLTKSITKFGVCEPIVINWDGTVIGGHQRLRILKKLGHKDVDVYLPSEPLSETETDELNIRLNKNSGSWDYDILANQWNVTDLIDWGFSLEELHVEEIPPSEEGDEEEKKKRKATMTITFQDSDHLQDAENQISVIIDSYEGATYKIKVL